MRYYELNCLISPNCSEEELGILQEKIKNSIQEEGGVLFETKSPIRKSLGYSIKTKVHPKTGLSYLAALSFNLAPEKLESLETRLKSEAQILRHLILQKKSKMAMKGMTKTPFVPIKKTERVKKEKVELKEIEEKLEEILGET